MIYSGWRREGAEQRLEAGDEAFESGAPGLVIHDTGNGAGLFEEALEFARAKMKRTAPSTDVQSIQHDIAEMASELEAMKVLVYSTAWKEPQGINPVRETSMTKYFCAETAKRIIMKGMNVLGEYGASMDYNMQRNLREILIFSIGGGTSQIQKNIICKTFGL